MQYKRRHARHIQKRLAAERAGRKVTKRTLDAIENNERWIEYFENLINQRQAFPPGPATTQLNMVAYIPNTPSNRRLIERYFSGHLPDSPDGKATEQRTTTFDGEEIAAYHWKGNTQEFNLNCTYADVLRAFIRRAHIAGATFSEAGSYWNKTPIQ